MTDAPSTTLAARAVGATKIYGSGDTEVRALDGVDVTFNRGEFTAIMGPSGSGKSTLMHCMAGLDDLTDGEVFIGETALSTLSEKDLTLLRRDNVGFIFQAFNLVPTLSAIENITLPMDLAGKTPDQGWVDQVIETVGLANRTTHRPNELSGGQQQMLGLAMALVHEPEVLIIDELSLGLAPTVVQQLLEIIDQLKAAGQTMIIVEQSLQVALAVADRAIFMEKGQVKFSGPTAELLERDDLARAVFLGADS